MNKREEVIMEKYMQQYLDKKAKGQLKVDYAHSKKNDHPQQQQAIYHNRGNR